MVPLADENRLRNLAWIEGNRRKVDQMTNGRVAYIYMPDTAFGRITSFNRYFFAQTGKEAAIIDERFNHGGMLASDIVEYLSRKPLAVGTKLRRRSSSGSMPIFAANESIDRSIAYVASGRPAPR